MRKEIPSEIIRSGDKRWGNLRLMITAVAREREKYKLLSRRHRKV